MQVDSTCSRSQGRAREAVGRGRQRAHRADLHGVAREVGAERLAGEGGDLDLVAAPGEVDQRLAGHLVGEAGAAAALDAALTVEQHQVARSAMGFSKWRFSSTKRVSPGPWARVWSCSGHSPPLSQTGQSSGWLTSRNSRTPSWAFFTWREVGDDVHAVGHRHEAGRLRVAPRGPSTSTRHIRQIPDRLHPRVVAEPRDVGPRALGGGDDHLALAGRRWRPSRVTATPSACAGLVRHAPAGGTGMPPP